MPAGCNSQGRKENQLRAEKYIDPGMTRHLQSALCVMEKASQWQARPVGDFMENLKK
jgi:hypothetical protein